MIRLSPYDPEIEAIWRALHAADARSVAVVAAEPGVGTTLVAGAIARRAGLSPPVPPPDAAATPRRRASDLLTPPPGNPADTAERPLPGLLVDLNLARPAVARLMGLHPKPGEIIRLEALGLAVLADPGVDGSDGWREPTLIAQRLAAWRRQWSMVVFDTSPLLSREVGAVSGVTLAAAADATVLVAMAGRTSASNIREARDMLNGAGARLIGTVMNDRDNPSLLSELERETYRLAPLLPRMMACLRGRLRRSTLLRLRV